MADLALERVFEVVADPAGRFGCQAHPLEVLDQLLAEDLLRQRRLGAGLADTPAVAAVVDVALAARLDVRLGD
ncbi:MAG: hypothetical protein V1907_01335 [Candidatus Kerfeldbacteria bacterium]